MILLALALILTGTKWQIHLGDYIYEGNQGGPRAHSPPREIFSLLDYRTRHGQVRISLAN